MKGIKLLLFSFILMGMIASCSDDDNNNSNPTPGESYFPLSEETIRTYRDDFGGNIEDYTYSFVDKVTINEKEYLRFSKSSDFTFSYLRVAANGDVYEYLAQFEREILVCKAELKTGDMWKNGDDGLFDFQVGETGLTAFVEGKTYSDVAKVYHLDSQGNYDEENRFILYAKGIGRIFYQLTPTYSISLIAYQH